jgi:hypothetical protein
VLTDTTGAPLAGNVTLVATDAAGAPVKLYADKSGGNQLTTLTVGSDGLISFYVNDTATLPVTVKAIANAAGHVSSSAVVTVNQSGSFSFNLNLASTSSTSQAGVTSSTASQTTSTTTGLSATLTAAVTSADPAKSAAQLTIPPSTILKDSSGAPLSGTVTATVTTFAPPTTAVTDTTVTAPLTLESFPGGLNNALIVSAGNTPASSGSFATAGFVAVQVADASGKQAASSTTPFTVRLDIPAGTINPETGVAVAVGETIPIWTYNEASATWKAEIDGAGNQVNGRVQSDAAGLYVQYTTNHFSYWNLDWFYGSVCNATINLTNDAKKYPMSLKATFTSGAGYLYSGYKPAGDGTVSAYRVPRNKKIDLYLIDSSNKVVASKKNFDWCAQPGSTVTLDYVLPATVKPVPVTITVNEYCTQDPSVSRVVPSTTTYARLNTSSTLMPGVTGTAGAYTYNLLPGTYVFYAYNRTTSRFSSKVSTISGAQTITFSTPYTCKQLTGSSGGVVF